MVGQVDEGRLVAGRYRLLERIGRGGMGTVWRAEDELLGRLVAVKKLHPPQPHMDDEELATLFERTRREARAAARISHPNVIVVHDVVDDEGLPSIVMEYVPSLTLGERLKQQGALPVAEVARIGRGMVAALRAAHRAGVLHRDVKPGNVLLGEDGRIVLTDFGIAQASGTSTLTRTGELIGSIDFLSPERIRGVPPGPGGDLWALGATLYQAVEGASPFRRPTAIETAYAIAEEPVVPAPNAGALTKVIAGLLAKEPEERLSAEEAERMLRLPTAEQDTALVERGRFQEQSAPYEPPTAPVTPAPAAGQYPQQQSAPLPGHETASTSSGGQEPYVGDNGRQGDTGGGLTHDTASHGGSRRGRPGRRIAIAVAAVVLVAAVAVAAAHYRNAPAGEKNAGPTGGPSAPLTTPPTATAASTPPPSSPPPLPDGYRIESEPSRGYSVPVPAGWTRTTNQGGDEVDFVDPTGKADLKISALDFASTSPLAHFENLEPATRSQVQGYHRERLDPTEQFGRPAAIWEFTFQGSVRKYHAIDLGFGKPGGTEYAVYVSAPDAKWQEYLPVFDNAVAGFRLTSP